MATKKQAETPAEDVLAEFKEIASTMPVADGGTGSWGESDEERRIRNVNQAFDSSVGYLRSLRDAYHDGEVQEMFNTAIAHAVTAQMWAVRAVKHRG